MSRKLTDEEERLWREATTGVKKRKAIAPRTPVTDVELQPQMSEEQAFPEPSAITKLATKTVTKLGISIPNAPTIAPLILGNYAGVDAATVRRIKRGQLAVSARVDLHGLTQAEAALVLHDFILSSVRHNKRLVLVITGKGGRGEVREAGVLKRMFPLWVNLPELRPHILAFDTAQIPHGGSGAFYVLLKRNRL